MKLFIQLYITWISFLPVDQKSDGTSQAESKSAEVKEASGDGSRFVDDTSTVYNI